MNFLSNEGASYFFFRYIIQFSINIKRNKANFSLHPQVTAPYLPRLTLASTSSPPLA
jgi:hypothetical protein